MESFLLSTGIVALAEIGDKTQLLSFLLARAQAPPPDHPRHLVATVANHALAGAVGAWITTLIGGDALRWILGISFIAMAMWMLVPGQARRCRGPNPRLGVFGVQP